MYSVPVRCSVSGVHSCMGTISRPVQSRQSSMVRLTFLSLGVAGSHLTWILNRWWSPVTRYRCWTSPAAHTHLEGLVQAFAACTLHLLHSNVINVKIEYDAGVTNEVQMALFGRLGHYQGSFLPSFLFQLCIRA